MKTARAQMILGCLRKALQSHGADLTDGQLLGQFVTHRDEAAFAALVRRHGPMVFGVCRRILRHSQDAEDAFQATFLVLSRKASRVMNREAVGSWLYGVAYRAAQGARASSLRRQAKEKQVEEMPHPVVMPAEDQHELLALLDRELARLPEKYRLPVVLCELEGRSRKEAARQLGLPEGTLSSRLATARKTLAKRMAAHGPAVTGASLTALFASEAGAACVPGPLVASTIRAAGGVVSAGVVALAEGVLKAMLLTKIKGAALVLLLAASVGVGTATLTYGQPAAGPPGNQRQSAAPRESQQTGNALQGAISAGGANPEKSDLEALRLEIEALRVSLQATRERVKVLEDKVNEQKPAGLGGGFSGMGGGVLIEPGTLPPGANNFIGRGGFGGGGANKSADPPPQPSPGVPGLNSPITGDPTGVFRASSATAAKAAYAAQIEAAAKELRKDPTKKEALDTLEHAVKYLKGLTEPKPPAISNSPAPGIGDRP